MLNNFAPLYVKPIHFNLSYELNTVRDRKQKSYESAETCLDKVRLLSAAFQSFGTNVQHHHHHSAVTAGMRR